MRKRKRNYAQERLDAALETGSDIVEPRCRYFGECGGCAWQSVAYERQLDFKREWVERAFREGGFEVTNVPQPIGSPEVYAYRNKMEFSFSARRWLTQAEIASSEEIPRDFALGLHARGAFDRILDIEDCPIQSEVANAYLRATREFARQSGLPPYDIRRQTGFFRYLILRWGANTRQVLALLVTTERKPEVMRAYVGHLRQAGLEPQCVANGVTDSLGSTSEGSEIFVDAVGMDLKSAPPFEERIGDWTFELAPNAFFQPNTLAAERLYGVAREFAQLRPNESLLDCYCGVGTLTLFLSPDAKNAVGIEALPGAVENARRNAARNGVENVRFLVHDLNLGIPALPDGVRPDVVVTDPPRVGMGAATLQSLLDLAPKRIVSVSCNPATQVENLRVLCGEGDYFIAEMRPVDLFPHTPHIENVALLLPG